MELHEEAPVARSVSDLGATIRRFGDAILLIDKKNNFETSHIEIDCNLVRFYKDLVDSEFQIVIHRMLTPLAATHGGYLN